MSTCRDIEPRGVRTKLYPREREIVRLLTTTGDSRKEIAARLGITYGTLKQYIVTIMDVLQLKKRTREGLTVTVRDRDFAG